MKKTNTSGSVQEHQRYIFFSVFTVLCAILLLFASCEQNSDVPRAASVTVQVTDNTNAKTISPSGNVNISHYVITISNQNTGESVSSGYLEKGQAFTVVNVTVGAWTAKVDAYIQNEKASGGYVRVASATSNPVYVPEKGRATLTVTLDSILDALSGDVTITAMLPSNFTVGSTVYAVWSLKGESNYSLGWDKALSLTVGNGNTVIFTLDADNLLGGSEKLKQGIWTMTLEVSDSKEESGQTIVKKGVEVLRLIAGLPASGVINLSAETGTEDGSDIVITDQVGDKLVLGQTGIAVEEGITRITLGYNGIPLDAEAHVYVDGEEISVGSSMTAVCYQTEDISSGKIFTIRNLSEGEHNVMISVSDGTALGTGSITVKVDAIPTLYSQISISYHKIKQNLWTYNEDVTVANNSDKKIIYAESRGVFNNIPQLCKIDAGKLYSNTMGVWTYISPGQLFTVYVTNDDYTVRERRFLYRAPYSSGTTVRYAEFYLEVFVDLLRPSISYDSDTKEITIVPKDTFANEIPDAILYKIGEDGAWQTYTAPFTVSESCTVYAKVQKEGYTESSEAGLEITI